VAGLSLDLSVRLASLSLRNPTVLASGILGISASLARRIEAAGAGAFTTKTVTREPRRGYFNPVFVELEHGYLNAIGLSNPGIDYFKKELEEMKRTVKIPVILSVGGSTPEEIEYVARQGAEAGVDALELNVSCPHIKGMGLEMGDNAETVREIVKRVKAAVGEKPVFVKISPHHRYVELADAALSAGADGVVAINTLRAMSIDIYAKAPVLSNVRGGYSGPAILPVAVRVVYDIYEAVGRVPIIGVGGVDSWRAAVELLLAGASAVGIGSAIAAKDLSLFRDVLDGLRQYMRNERFSSVEEIVGYAHKV